MEETVSRILINPEDINKPEKDKWEHMLFELTNYCNLNCPFCLNASSKHNHEFMSFHDFKLMIDKVKTNVKLLQLSGGEPTANPEFEKMVEYLIKLDMRFHLNTNGTLLSEQMLSRFIEYPKASIQFSLDGARSETDDEIRGAGHFQKVLHLMGKLHEHHYKRGVIKMVINRKNKNQIEDLFALAINYGFLPTYAFLVKSGRAFENWKDLYLDDNEKYKLRNKIFRLIEDNIVYFSKYESEDVLYYLRNMNINYVGECHFNLDHYNFTGYIHTDGAVQPCEGFFDKEFSIGNLLEEAPEYIFSHENPRVIKLAQEVKKRRLLLDNCTCKDCSLNHMCGKGCIAEAYNKGNFYGRSTDCVFRKNDFISSLLSDN